MYNLILGTSDIPNQEVGVSMDNTLKVLSEKIRPLGFNLDDGIISDTRVGRVVGHFSEGMDISWCDVRWFKLARRMSSLGYEYRFDTDRRALFVGRYGFTLYVSPSDTGYNVTITGRGIDIFVPRCSFRDTRRYIDEFLL